MDIRMPVMEGIEATRQIAGGALLAATRVVIVTTLALDEQHRTGEVARSCGLATCPG